LLTARAHFQTESGAEMIQVFESWGHQLSLSEFERYPKPATIRPIEVINDPYPSVQVIYFVNGASSYSEFQRGIHAERSSGALI
jgi:uroporphyrinogen-III decarboxylase